MNYQDIIKDSKFYLPMNLNLGYLLTNDTDIVILMNVINCDNIKEKLSVRKLMRYTNRSNNTVQQSLTRLRAMKLIDGFVPKYDTLKYIFDSINNSKTIEERKNWCKMYQDSIQNDVSISGTSEVYQELVQQNVSESGTVKCIENWYTEKEDIEKKDENKENTYIHNKDLIKKEKTDEYEAFQKTCESLLECKTENELIAKRASIASTINKRRIEIPRNVYSRCMSYLDSKYNELSQLVMAEASTCDDMSFLD